jgi:pre-mRNA branch site protein p14
MATDTFHSQIRQGIASNTKGTAFVVYEDVMDAKAACDKLNGFNFQNRYLVGTRMSLCQHSLASKSDWRFPVLYHQPDKMAKTQADIEEREKNLEELKRQHGID